MEEEKKGKISVEEFDSCRQITMSEGTHINITFLDGQLLIGIPKDEGYKVVSRMNVPSERGGACFKLIV